MEKTTEIQNRKNSAIIFSDIKQQVKDGKGFFSVCKENRKQRKISPARKSINDLECALKLLGKQPAKEEYPIAENSFYWGKLSQLFEPESKFPNKRQYQYKKKHELRKKFHDLIDFDINSLELEGNTVIQESEIRNSPEIQPENMENIPQQKFLLFNYLIAEGFSPEEARQRVENLLLETI